MGRKWILGLTALAAAGATAFATSSVLGDQSDGPDRPAYASVEIRLSERAPAAARPRGSAGKSKAKRPRVIYLRGEPTTVDVAQTGPNIDVRLRKCPRGSRVIDGGIFPGDTAVFQQGSYVSSRREYHVLLGFPDPAMARSFTLTSHLTCLKGVR